MELQQYISRSENIEITCCTMMYKDTIYRSAMFINIEELFKYECGDTTILPDPSAFCCPLNLARHLQVSFSKSSFVWSTGRPWRIPPNVIWDIPGFLNGCARGERGSKIAISSPNRIVLYPPIRCQGSIEAFKNDIDILHLFMLLFV